MSHLISKITFKIFMIVLAAMFALAGYFSINAYRNAIEFAEESEAKKIEAIVNTYALHLETLWADKTSTKTELENPVGVSQFKSFARHSLLNIERINGLKNGLGIIVIPSNRKVELINRTGLYQAEKASKAVHGVLENMPSQKVKLNLEESGEENHIFYAYPLGLNTNEFKAYVFAEENIEDETAIAKADFWRRLGVSFLAFILIGFIGHKLLQRILKHEVFAKKKLKEYADLAQARNEELEMLNFVLRKSDNLILLTDRDGKILWLNEHYQKKNNYSEDELDSFVGKELAEVSHYPRIQEVIDKVKEDKQKFEYEAKSYDNNKNEFWASTTVTPILDDMGEVSKLLFIDADITRLKMAEQEIAKLANFAKENTRPVIRIAEDHTVLSSNDSGKLFLRLWGTAINKKISKSTIIATLREALETKQEKKINLEVENRIYSMRFFPLADKGYVNVYGEDITEVKLAEKESRDKALKIEQHNLNITDSINYARKIQEAILPDEDHIRQFFKNSFALSKPKDIVSGDFFWVYELEPKKEYLLGLADCTGHGVPGAMMSIVGHSLLNEIVETEKTRDPAEILEHLNKQIIKSLRQKNSLNNSDGMDVSILKINIPKMEIVFSGAYQHIYWMNGKLNILKGDRQPIGGLHHDNERRFTNHRFKVSKGDCLYLSTDGFVDQFGGPQNKKFLSSRFAQLIEQSHKYSMQAQSFIYNRTFEDWKGQNDQIDDVSMIGIKF